MARLAPWTDVDRELPAEDISWFAIRQPSMVKLLERELWDGDGDAFALALDAACRVSARVTHLDGVPPPRLSRELLEQGLALARQDGVDPALGRWLRWCIDAAPVVITADEERCVMECITAMLWAIAAADLAGVTVELGETMIA
jgi:hypothetical protein